MTRAIPCAVALLCVLLSGFVPGTARADAPGSKTPVYVLSIWTDDADDQADALTQALRSRVRQLPGWSLLQTTQSFETLAIALKCPPKPDPPCLQRIGDQLKAEHYVWGTIDKKRGLAAQVSVDLHMWTRARPETNAHESYSDSLKDPNDESLRVIASGLLARLEIVATPTPAVSAVTAPVARGEQRPPTVTVAPAPSVPATESSAESGPFPTRTVFGYSAVVAGAGLLVVSVVEMASWIKDNDRSNDDRKLVPMSVTDVCAEQFNAAALDACKSGKDAVTSSTLGWIFGGVGAALVGTGIWLIATDDGSKNGSHDEVSRAWVQRRLKVVPIFGARATSLEVSVTF